MFLRNIGEEIGGVAERGQGAAQAVRLGLAEEREREPELKEAVGVLCEQASGAAECYNQI